MKCLVVWEGGLVTLPVIHIHRLCCFLYFLTQKPGCGYHIGLGGNLPKIWKYMNKLKFCNAVINVHFIHVCRHKYVMYHVYTRIMCMQVLPRYITSYNLMSF